MDVICVITPAIIIFYLERCSKMCAKLQDTLGLVCITLFIQHVEYFRLCLFASPVVYA